MCPSLNDERNQRFSSILINILNRENTLQTHFKAKTIDCFKTDFGKIMIVFIDLKISRILSFLDYLNFFLFPNDPPIIFVSKYEEL